MSAGYLGDSTTVPFLEDLSAGGNPDANSRFAAIISLGDIGGPRGAGVLSRLASDPEEMADVRFAALTALEELVAKRITSGPDRRFDPPENSSTASPRAAMDEPIEVSERRVAIVRDLRSIESDTSADDMLKLKAADVRRYLDSGVA
ncbi:hypothetical protein AAW14_14545 [Streptomyces hygroscopicus]|nr:hypothetical protein [Streptomyces hygroscopicus]